jgi:uncharacterized protein
MLISAKLIEQVTQKIQQSFTGEGSGHDWWHIYRVVNTATYIARQEGADVSMVQLAALLHDVGDHKFYENEDAPQLLIKELLKEYHLEEEVVESIIEIVLSVSYKGAGVVTVPNGLEAKCVQDADRLDAMGAIGIARAFAFGGNRSRLLYDPNQPPNLHKDFEAYKKDKGHTINHFYEKLLLLKDRMQTKTGRGMAEERHQFMELFLREFYKEWNYLDEQSLSD